MSWSEFQSCNYLTTERPCYWCASEVLLLWVIHIDCSLCDSSPLVQAPLSHLNPAPGVCVLWPAMPWSPWVGTPRTPVALSTLLIPPTSPLQPPPRHEHPTPSQSSPRTEVSFQVAMEMSHGRNVKGGKGRAGGGEVRVQPSVLEPACLKTSQGKERDKERERREARGGGICADTTPGGDLCQCCNRVPARLSSRDCGKDCQCVNTCKNKRRVFNSSCSIWNLPEVFSLDKTGGWRAWRFSFLINQHLQLSAASVPLSQPRG